MIKTKIWGKSVIVNGSELCPNWFHKFSSDRPCMINFVVWNLENNNQWMINQFFASIIFQAHIWNILSMSIQQWCLSFTHTYVLFFWFSTLFYCNPLFRATFYQGSPSRWEFKTWCSSTYQRSRQWKGYIIIYTKLQWLVTTIYHVCGKGRHFPVVHSPSDDPVPYVGSIYVLFYIYLYHIPEFYKHRYTPLILYLLL